MQPGPVYLERGGHWGTSWSTCQGSNLVIYLSIAVDILEHKERTTHDPVPSSGISAGLANSKHRTLYREARLCRLDSSRACWTQLEPEPTGFLTQGTPLTVLIMYFEMHRLFEPYSRSSMNRLLGSIISLEFASQVRETPLSHLKNNNQNKQTNNNNKNKTPPPPKGWSRRALPPQPGFAAEQPPWPS